jgi:hypothetical protein
MEMLSSGEIPAWGDIEFASAEAAGVSKKETEVK